MILIDQHTKGIMEECKIRARDAGLVFDDETLEYVVTNKDLIELSPKVMIPTLYDYWVHDVEVLKGQGKYKLFPGNPYETVINTRPAISFYNDNNPDWLNIMIFYHVIAHIDFFQNNILYEKTWDDDFVGQALADKRLIAALRSEHGRWVDYIIEFSRSIDNLTGYFSELAVSNYPESKALSQKQDYYFNVFLPNTKGISINKIYEEIERFNDLNSEGNSVAESAYFSKITKKYPEFNALFKKHSAETNDSQLGVMEFIRDNSSFLKNDSNSWMKSVLNIVRNTALYFEPQIRTKIINEGWASYWHDELFRQDERIKGHEIAYANTNAGVTSISRVGLNPYAIGLRLLQYVEDLSNHGKLNFSFSKVKNIEKRKIYDNQTGKGKESIFELRKNFSDFMLINSFVDQDFMSQHDLFVTGIRFNQQRNTQEYYVKSKKAADYKDMLINSLYHPPRISVNQEKTKESNLHLEHHFEGKQLYKDYIADTLVGIEYLWGGQVELETTEIVKQKPETDKPESKLNFRKVMYTMKNRKLSKINL